MKAQMLLWGIEISLKRRLGRGLFSAKNTTEGAARGQKLGQPQAYILSREVGAQLSCSLRLEMGQWTLPNAVCHLCLTTVGSQHLLYISRFAHCFAPYSPFPIVLTQCHHTCHLALLHPHESIHILDVLQTSYFVLTVLRPLSSGNL